jgi:hypothetical protein
MALLTKYYPSFSSALLVGSRAVPTRRQYFRSMAPYITLQIGLVLTLPHIWWMVASGFPTIDYAPSQRQGLIRWKPVTTTS